ncbi:putative ABC transport system permease protein [Kitasatospora cineracea]|uniref:ABC transport system permease protein n=2 Tax=Kitasatospora cineracea TaxID=88074 RepID=A0A3N4REX2_9ACTN|nr:ABC transporter permease [Kitasatospora cineracea]ROR37274.1 putative ABC transport system permease protein [Kitasatospora cineracea]RPE29271.1 putative ABC transport system permease protein [Kitasatospora cineracea]
MFVALRDIRFARGRFALMGAVVTLITTLVVFLYGLTGGLASAASSTIAELPADGVVFGAPAGAQAEVSFASSTVSPAQRDAVAAAGAGAVHPLGVAMSRLTAGGGAASVSVLGTDPELLPPLVRGAAPADGQLAVGTGLAAEYHLSPGSRVSVGAQELTVSAVTAERSLSHAPSVWTTPETWQRVSGQHQPTALAVRGTPHGLPADLRAVSLGDALSGINGYAAEQGSLQLIQGFLFAVSALVVGAFFTVWTVQRRPDIAVLKAVGASSGYLVRDALAQAAAVLLAGALLGGALGAAGGAFASAAVPFDVGVLTVAVPVGAMVLLGLLGAALAVRRITAVDPLAALGANR